VHLVFLAKTFVFVFVMRLCSYISLVCATFYLIKVMAEGGNSVAEGDISAETVETFSEPLTVATVLTMNVDELRRELRERGVVFSGVTKPRVIGNATS